jgi:hypothetical protein
VNVVVNVVEWVRHQVVLIEGLACLVYPNLRPTRLSVKQGY